MSFPNIIKGRQFKLFLSYASRKAMSLKMKPDSLQCYAKKQTSEVSSQHRALMMKTNNMLRGIVKAMHSKSK